MVDPNKLGKHLTNSELFESLQWLINEQKKEVLEGAMTKSGSTLDTCGTLLEARGAAKVCHAILTHLTTIRNAYSPTS